MVHRMLLFFLFMYQPLFVLAEATEVISKNELRGKSVLFVVGEENGQDNSDDLLIKEYLEFHGLSVHFATADDSIRKSKGKDLILISATADARVLGERYREVAIPILTWNAYSYPLLEMTGSEIHEDFSVVRESVMHQENHANFYSNIVNATHPLGRAAEVTPGLFGALFFSGETDMNWGKPTLSSDVIATFKDRRNNASVFVYESGASMDGGFVAPARRAGIFLGTDSFHQLTYAQGPATLDAKEYSWFAGLRIFDATLRWALSKPAESIIKKKGIEKKKLKALAKGKKLLYVRRLDMPWPAGESSVNDHIRYLKSLGFEVTVRDTMDSDDVADQYDLVIVSAAVNKFKFANKYADSPVPVLLEETKNVDGMNMAGRERTLEYGTNDHKDSIYPPEAYINVVRASHPMAGSAEPGLLKLYNKPGVMGWSKPGPGAFVIAGIPNQSDHAAVWGYEKGATMAHDHVAPAKRAVFPIDFNMFSQLSEEGVALYNAVLLWCIED